MTKSKRGARVFTPCPSCLACVRLSVRLVGFSTQPKFKEGNLIAPVSRSSTKFVRADLILAAYTYSHRARMEGRSFVFLDFPSTINYPIRLKSLFFERVFPEPFEVIAYSLVSKG